MAVVALNTGQVAAFLGRHAVTSDMVGRHGIFVRDGSRFIDVYAVAGGNGMGFLDVTDQAGALGITDMEDGEIRQFVPTVGQAQEAGILDIVGNIPDNVTYDPSVLTEGAQTAADAVSAFATEAGRDLGTITGGLTEGIGQGLSNVKLFGLPLPIILLVVGLGYVTFLFLPQILSARRAR